MNLENNESRRKFIKEMAIGGSAAFLLANPWLKAFAENGNGRPGASDQVKLAIVGTGSRGTQLLNNLFPIMEDVNIKIVAICDNFEPHLQKAFILCKNNGHVPATYVDHRKLLEKEKPDGVIIATPLTQHAHIAVDFMTAGIHTFCEKSMARSLEDIKRMYDTHLGTGKILQIGHQRLFNPIYIDGINKIHEGAIGSIGQMRAFWHRNNNWRRPLPNNDPTLEKQINWRLYKELSAGLLTELMTHQLHIANWIMQDSPVSVTGTGSIVYWDDGRTIPDNVALIFSYKNGVQFIYDSMTSNRKYGLEEQIMGSKGTIEFEANRQYSEKPPVIPGIQQLVNNIEHGVFDHIPIGGASWIPETAVKYKGDQIAAEDFYEDTQFELEAFVGFIRKGSEPPSLLKDAYYASLWAILGEHAIDSGLKVTLPQEYMI